MSLAELFGIKETWRQRMKHARFAKRASLIARRSSQVTQHAARSTQHFVFETLEPRILLSGTPGPIVLDQAVPETGLAGVIASAQSTPVVLLDSGTETSSGITPSSDLEPQAVAPAGLAAIDRVNDAGSAIALTWIPSASGGEIGRAHV